MLIHINSKSASNIAYTDNPKAASYIENIGTTHPVPITHYIDIPQSATNTGCIDTQRLVLMLNIDTLPLILPIEPNIDPSHPLSNTNYT
jgi:hypothetical protein